MWNGFRTGGFALRAASRSAYDRGMSHTYKKLEIVGISSDSFAKAASSAVKKAAESLHGLSWFEVTEMRGAIKDGKIDEYQVTLKVGLKLD